MDPQDDQHDFHSDSSVPSPPPPDPPSFPLFSDSIDISKPSLSLLEAFAYALVAACSDTGQVDNTFPGYSTPFIPGLTATLRKQHFEALADVYKEVTGYRGLIDLHRFIHLFALSSNKDTKRRVGSHFDRRWTFIRG